MHLHLILVAAFSLPLTLLATACDDADDPPLARVVTHADTDRREIALTFDAGIDGRTEPGAAAEILRVLRERGVRATFSLTGLWAETNRDLLFTIAADGHQIINGTYAGEPWIGASAGLALPASERKLALSRAEVTVYRYTSRSTLPYVRVPGVVDDGVRRDAAANGYNTILSSSVDCPSFPLRGIVCFAETSDRFARGGDLPDMVQSGAIVALGISDVEADALGRMIDGLRDDGYALVTVDALLAP